MKITPYKPNTDLEDLDNLYVIIKAVPIEDGFAPAVVIISPEDDYILSIDELNSLMDGIEIAGGKISEIINYIMNNKTFGDDFNDNG